MKIALFKNIEFGFDLILSKSMENYEGHIRISEYIDPDFPPRSDADIVTEQISAMKSAKAEILAEAQNRATEIDRQIGELLAITHQGE